jgi:hypothetical protein
LIGSWGHLARRFFWSLRVAPLSDGEIVEVAKLVEGGLLDAFMSQNEADRRHGLDSARAVKRLDGRHELIVAALLHDVGKRHADVGVVGRSVASVLAKLGLPAPGRLGSYLDHPRTGAEELAGLGAPAFVVEFTRAHHGSRPSSIPPEDWALLVGADAMVFGDERFAG